MWKARTCASGCGSHLSLDEFFTIAIQCAEALVSAHRHGIVHCDIKPENIMLTSAARSKYWTSVWPSTCRVRTRVRPWTAPAPLPARPPICRRKFLLEQAPDGRADIFSLGVVFYEVLTGQHPFMAGSFVATTDRIRGETPASSAFSIARFPGSLEVVVNKAMAKDAGQRYSSAEELLEALREVHGGLTSSGLARPVPLPQPHPRRKKWLWAARSRGRVIAFGSPVTSITGFVRG